MRNESSFHRLTDQDLEQVAAGADCSPNLAAYCTCINVSDYFSSLGLSDQAKSFEDMGVGYGKGKNCG